MASLMACDECEASTDSRIACEPTVDEWGRLIGTNGLAVPDCLVASGERSSGSVSERWKAPAPAVARKKEPLDVGALSEGKGRFGQASRPRTGTP